MADLELAYKPDAGKALQRLEAWWNMAVLDRPAMQVTAPRPATERRPWPEKRHASLRERWMDVEYAVECADVGASNTYYGGDVLPQFFPNLGPEIMTASYGAELEFGESTSWSVPCLHDWADIPSLRVEPCNPYVQCILDMTRLSLDVGRGKFLTAHTDLHPGADLAASLRDPQQFCVDLAQSPAECLALMRQIRPAFYEFFELQHALIREAGQTVTTSWIPIPTEGRYYIPSNDFSCMVSTAMNREFFLWETVEEIEWLDRSIYHLDGPGALRHLGDLLAIPKLGAIQWVYGAGNEPASRWMDVYHRVQAAGKGLQISCEPWEIEVFMRELKPEGVLLCTWAASPEEAERMLATVAKWTRAGAE